MPILDAIFPVLKRMRTVRQRLEEASERLRLVQKSGDAGLWDWDLGTDMVGMSSFNARMYGLPVPEQAEDSWIVIALSEWEPFVCPEDRPHLWAAVNRALATGGTFIAEFRSRDPANPTPQRWLQTRGSVVLDPQHGTPVRIVGLLIDVTARREVEDAFRASEAQLRISEERLALALDSGEDGLFDWDMTTDTVWVSERWLTRLGYQADPGLRATALWRLVLDPKDRRLFVQLLRAHLDGHSAALEVECRQRRGDGTTFWVLMRARVAGSTGDGRASRIVGTMIDISQRKEAELRVAHMALHDALTDLPNRNQFRLDLDYALAESISAPNRYAVLTCDLDRFKAINDTFGHPAGDRLLCLVAKRIASVLRKGDAIARLGGDEFAMILSDIDDEAAVVLACERIILALSQPIRFEDTTVDIGISLGAALLAGDGTDAEEVFKRADIALYQAKADGRNTYRMFDAETHARSAARSMIALDMREAIRRGDFFLVYQPVVDVISEAVVCFEALMRWRHPVHGLICPTEFIPMAEENGLIVRLGAWALAEACREALAWPEHVIVAVNVSAVQFGGCLEQDVVAALAAAGLPAQRLKLEVTESLLLHNPDHALAVLHRLRALGVRIALDDFGTGYANLGYLRRFPFDKLKLDRSFIRDIADPDAAAIVQAVVGLGKRLGMGIVAEGVETRDQLERVRREGCTEVQGYFFSKPLPAPEALTFLVTQLAHEQRPSSDPIQ